MKNRNINRPMALITATAMLFVLSSCNRGIGCPSDFSIGEFFQAVGSTLLSII